MTILKSTRRVGKAQGPFEDLANRLQNSLQVLEANLTAIEATEPWGRDPTGKAFVSTYAGPKEELLSGLDGTSNVVSSTADGVKTMATGYHGNETDNTAAAKALSSGSTDNRPVSSSGVGAASDAHPQGANERG